MKRIGLWRAAVPCAFWVVGCTTAVGSEDVGSTNTRLSGASEDSASLGGNEVAAWNESIAFGECSDERDPAKVVPCSMMTHAMMAQPYPAAPLSSGLAWGVKRGSGAWEMHVASLQDWGAPATPFYDGTSVLGYSTDAAISYIARDTFVVTAIADSTTGVARGAVVLYTSDAGRTWSTPVWAHRGCDLLGGLQGPTPTTFWNVRQHRFVNDIHNTSSPAIVNEVGHYACCPGQAGGPPGDPHDICGGEFAEEADFGVFATSPTPNFNRATTLTTEQDGWVRGSTHYLEFAALDSGPSCAYLVAEYPITSDGEGPYGKTFASRLGGACPSSDTYDVTWRTQFAALCLCNLGNAVWKPGPDVDRDGKSPRCVGDSDRLNSWLPAMGVTPDLSWIGTAVSVSSARGQRIRATELAVSSWPPLVSPWQYRSDDPDADHATEQLMPNLSYRPSGDVALTWVDDRFGATPGELGALVGVGSKSGFHVFDLDASPTTLIAHKSFANTGILWERSATHVGLAEAHSPTASGFSAAISRGDRVASSNFSP